MQYHEERIWEKRAYQWSQASATYITVAVTKLHASRSQQNRAMLQHEQRKPGE
jgi:hypothetical protein